MSQRYFQILLDISWNDLSNASKFARFRVCMSELRPLKVGLLYKRNVQIRYFSLYTTLLFYSVFRSLIWVKTKLSQFIKIRIFTLGLRRKKKEKRDNFIKIDQESWCFHQGFASIRYVRLPYRWDRSPTCNAYLFQFRFVLKKF